MLQSWRWFGPQDPVSLREIRQAGATDIVTALHHLRCGDLWTVEEIQRRVAEVEAAGLSWTVVESVPVHEDLKTRQGDWPRLLETYKQSLRNLAQCGVRIVCYNFMPVLDWTRTELDRELPDGSRILECDIAALAAFDCFLLQREGAEADYSPKELAAARLHFAALNEEGRKRLADSILMGLPGTVDDFSLEDFRRELQRYEGLGAPELRAHLFAFLRELMPLCQELGLRMAIHPDDPPRPIFGLPRILSTPEDVEQLFAAVPEMENGLTLCTGSFGGRRENDPATMLERFASRVHFAHFRNVTYTEGRSFQESSHLYGHVDMPRAMRALILEEERRRAIGRSDDRIPVRPDHGRLFDCDRERGCYAGYSYVGRLVGLAELRGLELGIRSTLGRENS